MNRREVFFGTREYATWIPAPSIGMDRGFHRRNETVDFFDGSRTVNRSHGQSRSMNIEWAMKSGEVIDEIVAFYNGDYGSDGVYLCDPFAMRTNSAPDNWASPWKAAYDGHSLTGWDNAYRPSIVPTEANNYGYPRKTAVYVLGGDENAPELWVPRPDGYTVHVGFHGSKTGTANVIVNGSNTVPLGVTTDVLTNTQVTTGGGAAIKVVGVGTLTATALIVHILPSGEPPLKGKWMTGHGYGRMSFVNLNENAYSAALDLRSLSGELIEDIGDD